jgi:glutamate carboxypeptidase
MRDAVQWVASQLPAMEAALAALVNVNSFTGNPEGGRKVGHLLDGLFALPGVSAEVIPSTRYAAHRVYRTAGRGDRQPVALLGHLDTVFPPGVFEGYRVDGDKRRGPGVLDMKGGLVVIAWALKALAQTVGLSAVPELRVVIVSDEEVGSPEGAPLIERVLPGCRAALVFESGRLNDDIVTRRKGTGAALVTASGKPAHAGNAYWQGANAIWALSRFVDEAQRLSSRETGVTVNVGLISGGTAKNTVPAAARAELDLRFPTRLAHDELWSRLRTAAQQAGQQVDGTLVEVHPGPSRIPMEKVPGTEALLESYASCAQRHGLGHGEADVQGGGSDGNTAANLGVPTLDALGPRGGHFHTPDEYLEAATLVPRTAALIEWLLDA